MSMSSHFLVLEPIISARTYHLLFQIAKTRIPFLCMLAVLGDMRTGFLGDRTWGIIGGIVEKHQLIFQNTTTGHIHPG